MGRERHDNVLVRVSVVMRSTMLRVTIYTTLSVILMLGAASAQTNEKGLQGYTNSLRTDAEKKNDREIDRAYQSTITGIVTTYSEQIKDDPVLEDEFARWQAHTMGISEIEIQWLNGKVDTPSFTEH
jgi:hypothetical protein